MSIQARKDETSESTGLIILESLLGINNTALSFERTLCKCSSRKRKIKHALKNNITSI